MKAGRPSWTAQLMALFRAVESARPPAMRLFDDPFAGAFLDLPFRCVRTLARLPGGADAVTWLIEGRWGGPLGAAVCRTRYIDDVLAGALAAGVAQVVILGAGFDARPYRLPTMSRAHVIEVDHPATQAVKKDRLARVLGALPAHVTFVPVDWGRERLEDAMLSSGLSQERPTFFLWEGVTNYLDADAVDTTLRWVARTGAPGSELLFTYIHRGMLDGSLRFEGAGAGSETVRRIGEPYTFGLDPTEVPAYLAARGLDLVEDVAAPEYRVRYLRPVGREMKIWEFYRAALARVTGVRVRSATPDELARCQAVRREVFVEEQGVPIEEEMDQLDTTSRHFLAFIGDEVVGTARLRTTENGSVKAERVAVRRGFRRHGVGRALMAAVEDAARGRHEIVLSAQVSSVAFYERLGYRAGGAEFVEAGIPHRSMSKRIG